ncbi:hypothetical protein FHS74_003580 [Nitrospirillum iridis]|uniref:Uncharacterized protein n=1 Tax=Nitrospirillum iridis TaxID=765888 RepID=A0A7X0B247_9PROT|nr:hypothetical protein [Nitrospirillum iridis]
MATHATKALELRTALLDVRYRRGDAAALLARCKDWQAQVEEEEWRLRDALRSGQMLESALDLLDNAAQAIRGVARNCEEILTKPGYRP